MHPRAFFVLPEARVEAGIPSEPKTEHAQQKQLDPGLTATLACVESAHRTAKMVSSTKDGRLTMEEVCYLKQLQSRSVK